MQNKLKKDLEIVVETLSSANSVLNDFCSKNLKIFKSFNDFQIQKYYFLLNSRLLL